MKKRHDGLIKTALSAMMDKVAQWDDPFGASMTRGPEMESVGRPTKPISFPTPKPEKKLTVFTPAGKKIQYPMSHFARKKRPATPAAPKAPAGPALAGAAGAPTVSWTPGQPIPKSVGAGAGQTRKFNLGALKGESQAAYNKRLQRFQAEIKKQQAGRQTQMSFER
jgi:hypothetical protein